MLDFLAGGGQYVAIIALCFSCWAVGRASRRAAMQAAAIGPDTDHHSLAAVPAIPEPGSDGRPAGQAAHSALVDAFSKEFSLSASEPLALRAAKVHDLIKTADLSQEGVIESLVAMAEEQACKQACEEPEAWKAGPVPSLGAEACDQPRILTRKFDSPEPLPAEMADPLSPSVLARYRTYAQESYAPDQTSCLQER